MDFTLDQIECEIAKHLSEAANSRHSPMHTPVVSTPDGDMRIMVLRAYDPEARCLRFHTDARAPKVSVLGSCAQVGVLFYDRDKKVQIRCRGFGRIETDTRLAETAWKESTEFARRCYLGSAPGEVSEVPTSGLPKEIEGKRPAEEDLLSARVNFAVLLVELDTIDWYHLSNKGHRRALFSKQTRQWLTP